MSTGRRDVAPFGTDTTASGKPEMARFVKRGSVAIGGNPGALAELAAPASLASLNARARGNAGGR
jgi:hypothetical protein